MRIINNNKLAKLLQKFSLCKYAQAMNLASYTPAAKVSTTYVPSTILILKLRAVRKQKS